MYKIITIDYWTLHRNATLILMFDIASRYGFAHLHKQWLYDLIRLCKSTIINKTTIYKLMSIE